MPTSSTELSTADRQQLLEVARESIRLGLEEGHPLRPDPGRYPQSLSRIAATFVTLKRVGELRGCIGTLEARQALVLDVAEHAFAAAFRDPRFQPVSRDEFDALEISISVLGEPEELVVKDERDLLIQLRPHTDGVILQEGSRRGTFLPSVWDSLPDTREFVSHLKLKAGLPKDYWSSSLRIWRYTTEEFGVREVSSSLS